MIREGGMMLVSKAVIERVRLATERIFETSPEDVRLRRMAYAEQDLSHHEAKDIFGQLNGWTVAKRRFTPSAIGAARYKWHEHDGKWRWADHRICYRALRPGKSTWCNIAMIGQPYGQIKSTKTNLTSAPASTACGGTFHPRHINPSGTPEQRSSS